MPSKLEARVTEHDRQIAAIRKLILAGMKMINAAQVLARENQVLARENQVLAKENHVQIKALAASQRETDRMLKGLIQSLERGGNGHRRADIR